jgi:hypothetical protein
MTSAHIFISHSTGVVRRRYTSLCRATLLSARSPPHKRAGIFLF